MLERASGTAVSGAAVVAAAAVLFRWPLSFTGLVVASGLLGGVLVGLRLEAYESPLYQGGLAGALGAVAYGAVLAAVGLATGPGGVFVALTEAVGMAMLLVFGAVLGALAGDRVSADGDAAGTAAGSDDGPTLRSGRTSDAPDGRDGARD